MVSESLIADHMAWLNIDLQLPHTEALFIHEINLNCSFSQVVSCLERIGLSKTLENKEKSNLLFWLKRNLIFGGFYTVPRLWPFCSSLVAPPFPLRVGVIHDSQLRLLNVPFFVVIVINFYL